MFQLLLRTRSFEPLNKEALQTKDVQVEPPSPTQAQITDIT